MSKDRDLLCRREIEAERSGVIVPLAGENRLMTSLSLIAFERSNCSDNGHSLGTDHGTGPGDTRRLSKAGSVPLRAARYKNKRVPTDKHDVCCENTKEGVTSAMLGWMGAAPEVFPEEVTSALGIRGWAVCQAGLWGQGVAGEGSRTLQGTEASQV